MNLTEHFTLEEMIATQHRNIDNHPSEEIINNLKRICSYLEGIRITLKHPIIVTSGYRSEALNTAVGGSKTSAHMKGLAADFICPGYGSPLEVAVRISMAHGLYDQIIHEHTWVHVALCEEGKKPREDKLTLRHGHYEKGLHA